MNEWYNSLSSRERNIVLYGSIAVSIILVWLLIIKPITNKKASLKKSIEYQNNTLATMQNQSAEIKELQKNATPSNKKKSAQPPQQLIERSLKKWALKDSLERMQSQGSKGIRLSLKDANADRGFQFLYELEYTHALTITNMAIDGDSKQNGVADFKLTIESAK